MINKKKEMIDRLIVKIIEAIFYTLTVTLYTNERRIERRIVANHCWFQSTRIEILIHFKEFFFSPPGLSRLFRSFLSLSFSLSSFSICESVAYFFLIGRSHSRVQLPVSFEEKDRSVFIDVLHVRTAPSSTLWIISSLDNYPVILVETMDFERAGCNNYSIDWNSTFSRFLEDIFCNWTLTWEWNYSNNFQRSVQSQMEKMFFPVNNILSRKWTIREYIILNN